MRRSHILGGAVILSGLITIPFVRIQPPGFSRVVRRQANVSVVWRRAALVAPFGTESCLAPQRGDQLFFHRTVPLGDVALNINFAYTPPTSLPRHWPKGDWCTSLANFVEQHVRADDNEDPHAAESRISMDLQRALAEARLRTSSVSAGLKLPPGWERTRPVQEVAKLAARSAPVLFVGLDGADWELLDDYISGGAMPNLARLVREGSSGVLETEHPPLSPLLWTTMMTGVSPLEHHVLDFARFNPSTGAKEPITSDERAVPAVWNMATMGGKRVAVFGLWATYPAEPVHGIMVSDRLFTFLFSESSPPPGIVFPPSREAWARNAVTASEKAIDFRTLETFLPWLDERQYGEIVREQNPYEKPGSALRRILIDTEVYRRLGTEVVSQSMPDLTIVYFEGTDTIGHIFAPYAPPKQPEVTQEDYDRYHQVPELYFRHVDAILGQFLAAVERHHGRVMLASDHGFQWKEGRPTTISSFATATAAKWHRKEGLFLLWGDGIAAHTGHTIHGTIRQVCATLIALTELPRGEHVNGLPLIASVNTATVDYRRFFKPFTPPAPPTPGSTEELAKLRALGYIGSGESTAPRPAAAGDSTKTAGAYNNEGLILRHEGRIADAIKAFDRATAIDPSLASAEWNLSDLLFEQQQDLGRADDLLIQALSHNLPDAPKYVIQRAIKYQRGGHADRSLKLLEGAVAAKPDDAELHMFRGRYRFDQKDCAGALQDFRAAAQIRPNDAVPFASAGLAEMCLGDHVAAEADFRHSLELNPNQPMLQRFLRQ